MKTARFLSCLLLVASTGYGQVFTETITKELAFEKKGPANALLIMNVNGRISVEGYNGDKVLVEVKKTINAKTEARLEEGKQEIQLGIMDRADTLIFYVNGSCTPFGRSENKKRNWRRKFSGWGYNWDNCCGQQCENRYEYTLDFTIKVPASVHVVASTVNRGDVEIKSISGSVVADNINGGIKLTQISGATNASCINGEVIIDFSGNPPADSRFYSLNGDITANFRKGLAAQLAFKSFNGDFYSSLNDLTLMPVQLERTDKGGEGTRYRVSGNRYKVRQGGPLLDFETFNGDVIVKEKEN